MPASSFNSVLKEWENSTVTIINPESYTLGKLGDKIAFESYEVTLVGVSDDFIHISYARAKKGEDTNVEQYIPIGHVKRVSIWGDEKFIQI
jgi:hypothetical protein